MGKKRTIKYLVSASRRTDMVVSQTERLIAALEGRLPSMPYLSAEKIHTLLISTKDFRPLLDISSLRNAVSKCDQVCVNLTITGFGGSVLEPRVPKMEVLLDRIKELIDFVGNPLRVTWCYSPILTWNGLSNMSIDTFQRIADVMATNGISRMMAVFFQNYKHAKITPDILDPTTKKRFVEEIDSIAGILGMKNSVCKYGRYHRSKCVDMDYFISVHPNKDASIVDHYRSFPPPKGHCRDVIWDIGWYKPPCNHGCLYCYGISS